MRWKGKDEMDKYKIMLAAHKSALDSAIDLTALYDFVYFACFHKQIAD
jgi:hypothetical protein